MKVLRYRELKDLKGINYSREHLRRLEMAGSFPKRVQLGENSVAWIEEEIDKWIEGRAKQRSAA